MPLNENNRKRLDDIITKMDGQGATREDVQSVVKDFTSKYGGGGTQPTRATGPNRNLFGLPESIEEKIFPSASKMPEGTIGQTLKRSAVGGLEALSLPTRAMGTVWGKKIEDPESAFFRPAMDWTKGKIEEASKSNIGKMAGKAFEETGFGFVPKYLGKETAKGAVELVGSVASDPLSYVGLLKKGAQKGGQILSKGVGRLSSELSGVSEEALRKAGLPFSQGRKALKAASGTQDDIGKQIIADINNFDDLIPQKIKSAVDQLPETSTDNIVNALRKAKPKSSILPESEAAAGKIDEIIDRVSKNKTMSGRAIYEMRKEFDEIIGDAFGKESSKYTNALKSARHEMKEALVTAARKSGNEEYIDLMGELSKKMETIDNLLGYVGKTPQVQERRVESFVANLFGKNKNHRQEVIQKLDDVFGKEYTEQIKMASLAAELGEEGTPGLLPRQMTGRSALGGGALIGGAASANPALVAIGSQSSPQIAATTLGALGALGKGVEKIPAEQLSKFGGVGGAAGPFGRFLAGKENEEEKKRDLRALSKLRKR